MQGVRTNSHCLRLPTWLTGSQFLSLPAKTTPKKSEKARYRPAATESGPVNMERDETGSNRHWCEARQNKTTKKPDNPQRNGAQKTGTAALLSASGQRMRDWSAVRRVQIIASQHSEIIPQKRCV